MKRTILLTCLFAVMAAGTGLKAQEVTISLVPGWNWISYPNAVAVPISEGFGNFTPAQGDMVKGQNATSRYVNGRWIGGVTQFVPGLGYLYYSTRSEETSFVFAQTSYLSVTTEVPTGVTVGSAVVGGSVTVAEGSHVFLHGVCWGTAPNPDIDGNHTSEELGSGSFSNTLEGLTPNTTYYVRAYAVTDYGLTYGNEVVFSTLSDSITPTGAINGKFTINDDGDQVYFSKGNLQYLGSARTPYWKFAENQWEVLGITSGQNSNGQNVDRDLFGWGTSGWNCGNSYYNPWDTYNSSGSSYGPLGANNLTGNYANSDWGVNNPIANGGNQPNQWRTLSKDEWGYVFNTRMTASGIRFAMANVNNVNGVILLPDDWNASYYALNNTNTLSSSFTSNTITASDWSILEQYGAVFLPATGYRFGVSVKNVGSHGYYWSSSYVNSSYAYGVYFYDSNLNPQDCSNRTYGRGVRLAHPAQ